MSPTTKLKIIHQYIEMGDGSHKYFFLNKNWKYLAEYMAVQAKYSPHYKLKIMLLKKTIAEWCRRAENHKYVTVGSMPVIKAKCKIAMKCLGIQTFDITETWIKSVLILSKSLAKSHIGMSLHSTDIINDVLEAEGISMESLELDYESHKVTLLSYVITEWFQRFNRIRFNSKEFPSIKHGIVENAIKYLNIKAFNPPAGWVNMLYKTSVDIKINKNGTLPSLNLKQIVKDILEREGITEEMALTKYGIKVYIEQDTSGSEEDNVQETVAEKDFANVTQEFEPEENRQIQVSNLVTRKIGQTSVEISTNTSDEEEVFEIFEVINKDEEDDNTAVEAVLDKDTDEIQQHSLKVKTEIDDHKPPVEMLAVIEDDEDEDEIFELFLEIDKYKLDDVGPSTSKTENVIVKLENELIENHQFQISNLVKHQKKQNSSKVLTDEHDVAEHLDIRVNNESIDIKIEEEAENMAADVSTDMNNDIPENSSLEVDIRQIHNVVVKQEPETIQLHIANLNTHVEQSFPIPPNIIKTEIESSEDATPSKTATRAALQINSKPEKNNRTVVTRKNTETALNLEIISRLDQPIETEIHEDTVTPKLKPQQSEDDANQDYDEIFELSSSDDSEDDVKIIEEKSTLKPRHNIEKGISDDLSDSPFTMSQTLSVKRKCPDTVSLDPKRIKLAMKTWKRPDVKNHMSPLKTFLLKQGNTQALMLLYELEIAFG